MILDTHVHFWDYDPVRDTWMDDRMSLLRRDFTPDDLLAATDDLPVMGFVAVQADQSREETDFLLELADRFPQIKGVIGWLDLCSSALPENLIHYATHPKFKGLRHIVQAEPAGFMRDPAFQKGISQLAAFNLVYEILVYAPQLPEAVELVAQFPEQQFVLDHLGKPDIRGNNWAEWAKPFQQLSQFDQCYCKLSGMVTEAHWGQWTKDDFRAYLDTALQSFGPKRLMIGSDWPVCLLAADYKGVYEIMSDFLKQLSSEEQALVRYQNAAAFYHL